MPPSASPRRARTAQRQRLAQERRRRRFAVLVVVAAVALVTGLLTAFGGSGRTTTVTPLSSSARQLIPAGPPQPEIVARLGTLHLQLPIAQSRVTAIGYQSGTDGALTLQPLGSQVNQGLLKRIGRTIFGASSGGPRWYQLPGGEGSSTSALDVGAAPGADVYAPVDGTIASIGKTVIDGETRGAVVDIEPAGAPSLVVSISHVRIDPALVVGAPVAAGASRIGSVLDFSPFEEQALARYTNDAGNHVVVEVHPAATLQVP